MIANTIYNEKLLKQLSIIIQENMETKVAKYFVKKFIQTTSVLHYMYSFAQIHYYQPSSYV